MLWKLWDSGQFLNAEWAGLNVLGFQLMLFTHHALPGFGCFDVGPLFPGKKPSSISTTCNCLVEGLSLGILFYL